MARQIIILDTPNSGGVMNVTGVNWFPISVTTARVAKPGFISVAAVLVNTSKAITAPEQSALESGAVLEEFFNVGFSSTTDTNTITAELQRRYVSRAEAIAALSPARQYFGIGWDGTSWT